MFSRCSCSNGEISIQLIGGLGNQLFQFGAALRASNFNLDLIRIIPSEDLSFQSKLEKLFSNNLIPEITSLSHFKNFLEHQEVLNIEDSGSPFLDTPILDHLSNENNYFLNGYFQSSSNALAIRKLFHDPKNSSFSSFFILYCENALIIFIFLINLAGYLND